jgi:hypothetical protein
MFGGSNYQIHVSMEQSSSSSSSRNWDMDAILEDMLEEDNVIEGIGRMTEGILWMTEGIMEGVERITGEAGRLTGSPFGFPSFPGNEREERSLAIFSFPIIEEEEEVDERDEHEMQEQEQE